MAKPSSKQVLFLSVPPGDLGHAAELFFQAAARRLGLNWTAETRMVPLDPTPPKRPAKSSLRKELLARGFRDAEFQRTITEVDPASLESASLVVVLVTDDRTEHFRSRLTDQSDRALFWPVGDEHDPLATIEREINDLIARILGGKPYVETASSSAPVAEATPRKSVTVKIGRETKGRRGKGVTILSEVPLDEAALSELATLLKTRCGTGGTVRDGRIEIQGDQRDRLTAEMEKLGYKVKRVGG
jgi:predicted translation initiation factor SUI1